MHIESKHVLSFIPFYDGAYVCFYREGCPDSIYSGNLLDLVNEFNTSIKTFEFKIKSMYPNWSFLDSSVL